MVKTIKHNYYYIYCAIPITALAFYFLYTTALFPYFHTEVAYNKQGDLIVTKVKPSGEAFKLGIKKNDIILKVNDKKPEEHYTFKKFNKLEQVETVDFKRGTEIRSGSVTHKYSHQETLNYLVFPSIIFIFCLSLGYIVSRSNEKNKIRKLLFYFLLILGLGYISAGASSRGDLIARIVSSISFILSPVILLHLLILLFKDLNIKSNWRWHIKWFYAISGCLAGVATIHELSNTYYKPIDNAQLLFFSMTAITIFYMLIRTYHEHRNLKTSPTIKVLLTGIILAFSPFLFMNIVPYLLFNDILINPEIALLFMAFLPLTTLYLINKERIVDIDFIFFWLKKDFFFSLLAGLLFFVISTVSSSDKTILNSMYVTLICLVVFSLSNRLYLKPKSTFNQPHSNFQQQLNHYFDKAKRNPSPSQLFEIIMSEIQIIIPKIEEVGYFQLSKTSKKVDMNNNRVLLESDAELLVNSQLSIGSITPLKDGFCVLIHERRDTLFYLFCGYKVNRTNLNPVERTWIETLANYSNVLLTNQYTIENVVHRLSNLKKEDTHYSKWLSKLLLSFSENERVRLASDLHDSVLQELLVVNNELESVLNNPLSDEDYAQIDEIKERVLDCVHTTRETCTELSPPFLVEFGLTQAIKTLIKKVHLRADYEVFFNFETFHDDSLSEEHIITLYRIIQELFTNAMKHSKADEMTLTLENTVDQVRLFYSDNGVGLEVVDLYSEDINYGGLIGIKERARNLDGTFELGHVDGLQIIIQLPLEVKPFTYQDIIQ